MRHADFQIFSHDSVWLEGFVCGLFLQALFIGPSELLVTGYLFPFRVSKSEAHVALGCLWQYEFCFCWPPRNPLTVSGLDDPKWWAVTRSCLLYGFPFKRPPPPNGQSQKRPAQILYILHPGSFQIWVWRWGAKIPLTTRVGGTRSK